MKRFGLDLLLPSPRARRILLAAFLSAGALFAAVAAAQDPAAVRLLREAERLVEGGDPGAALEELELLIQQFPRDPLAPRALLRMAELQIGRSQRAAAEASLDRLLAEHARSAEAATAMTRKAELAVLDATSSADLEEARTAFRRVPLLYGRDAFPELEARRRARVASGELSLILGEAESAAADFVAAVEDEPPSQYVGRARLGLARAWTRTGDLTAAVEVLERLASADEATATAQVRARARVELGLLHRRLLRAQLGLAQFATSGRFAAPGLALREPAGVAAAGDGRIAVLDPRLESLVFLQPDGSLLSKQTVRGANRPGWLDDGRAFVATDEGVVLPLGGASYSFNDPRRSAPLKNLLAAAPGTFGDFFIVARGAKSLLHLRPNGSGRELLAEQRGDIVDVARGPMGSIYALDGRGGTVTRLDRDGKIQGVVVRGNWKRPVALDVDDLGFLYVLDRGNGRVDLFDPDGRRVAALGPALGGGVALRQPADLAVDGSGRVFVVDEKLPFLVILD